MAKSREHARAIALRRRGSSVSDIAKKLNVSKGSVSRWCQGVTLTKAQEERLKRKMFAAGHVGRQAGAAANRAKKALAIKNCAAAAANRVARIEERDRFMLGIALYWAEGSKRDKCAVVNSDPDMIVFMQHWFQDFLQVEAEDFMPRIFIQESHRDRTAEVVRFWAKQLGLPKGQFGTPTFLPNGKKSWYPNRSTHFGVLALRVRRGTALRYTMLGLIDAVKRSRM